MPPLTRQINVTYRCGMMYRDRQLADLGLNGCQSQYLLPLYWMPGISQEALAEHLCVHKSSVTRQLSALEAKGFVRRETDKNDRRSLLVYPTEKALAIKDSVYAIIHDWRQYLLRDFNEEERETLNRLMERVASRAKAYVKGDDAQCTLSERT